MPPKILIIGSGIAGLCTAIKAAKLAPGAEISIVNKSTPDEGATRYAQGGIAAVWSSRDSFDDHKTDTLRAGAGLCNNHAVETCVREGPLRVQELIDLGVKFTRSEGRNTYDLHREGGHSRRRILHADDLTGLEIERALLKQAGGVAGIKILDHHIAIDLITEGKLFRRRSLPGRCLGAYLLDINASRVVTSAADITILATGGAGKIYLYTSNPDVSTGDGIAMAYRAGARIANMEFIQFHPTCLFHPAARNYLVSEALRGEGAELTTLDGEKFMTRHHPMGSLAPRDIVARAIDREIKRTGDKHVLLDCRPIGAAGLRGKFPNIYENCLRHGIDITAAPIPVVPAAHYTCGGVLVDENARTTIDGLYAVGETACSGLHGANRLASNSLLEAVVYAHRAASHATGAGRNPPSGDAHELPSKLPDWQSGQAVQLEEQIDIAASWLEIRTLMWNYAGIIRSNRRLERARRRLEILHDEIFADYWNFLPTRDLIELRNILTVAGLIIQSAMLRRESRGLHYSIDYPETDDVHFKHDTVL